jgi:hypothetical protein
MSKRIDWDASDARSLDAERRAIVCASWIARARQEHLAVGAFSLLAYQVAQHGGDPKVLELLARAPSDEHRHAQICARYASLHHDGASALQTSWKGVPKVPRHAGASGPERTLLHVVEMCCMSETFTGIGLTEMLERASSPLARQVIESLLEDEIDHGRVGWAHASTMCAEPWGRALVSAALPAMLSRSVGPVVRVADRGPRRDEALDAHGFLDAADVARVYREGLRDVVFPGFEMLGVDVGAAREHARSQGLVAS